MESCPTTIWHVSSSPTAHRTQANLLMNAYNAFYSSGHYRTWRHVHCPASVILSSAWCHQFKSCPNGKHEAERKNQSYEMHMSATLCQGTALSLPGYETLLARCQTTHSACRPRTRKPSSPGYLALKPCIAFHSSMYKRKVKTGDGPHFWDLVFSLVPSSQISPRRQARLALVTLVNCCGKSCRTASGSGQGGLPAGYTPEAATSKCSLGLRAARSPAAGVPELLPCSSAC